MGGSSNHKTNNASGQPEDCSLLKMFVPCSGACCEPGEATHTGYKLGDPAVGYCMNGQMMVAKPLSPTDSCDDPFQGTLSNPPTWRLCSLEQWIAQTAGADGADGQDGADGADATVTTCPLDYLTPWVVGMQEDGQLVNSQFYEPPNSTNGLNTTGAWVVKNSTTITKAQLDALGMRPEDNAVVIRMDTQLTLDDTAGTMPADAFGITRVTVDSCDGAFQRRSAVRSDVNTGSFGDDATNSRIQSHTIPLNADGSFTFTHDILLSAGVADVENVSTNAILRVEEFLRTANSCYVAATPTCMGVVPN